MIFTIHVGKQDQRSLIICQGHTAQEGVELKSKPWSKLSRPLLPKSLSPSPPAKEHGDQKGRKRKRGVRRLERGFRGSP